MKKIKRYRFETTNEEEIEKHLTELNNENNKLIYYNEEVKDDKYVVVVLFEKTSNIL